MIERLSGTDVGVLCVILVWLAAAGVVFVFAYNRYIIQMADARRKYWAVLLTFWACVVGGLAAALATGVSGWVAVPAVLLAGAVVGEIDRLRLRRRHAGTPPVETEQEGIRLLKPITTFDLAFRRYEVQVGAWCGGRFRAVHISDLHVHDGYPDAFLEGAVERVNQAEPDVVFLTGDFVTSLDYAPMLPDLLGRIHARHGVFGVLGNHDYWAGADHVAECVTAGGVVLVGDAPRTISLPGGHSVLICGCEEPWGQRKWRSPEGRDDALMVLTHTADNIYRLARCSASAVFAGHYHAGQGRLPWVGSVLVPSRYGRRFDHGHFRIQDTHLFVTAGIGCASPPLRIYCQPEIVAVDFVSSPAV